VTRKAWLFGCVAMAIAAAAMVRSQPVDAALDPLKVAPDSHKLAFENAFVRILEVHVLPGKTEPRHAHPHGLSVYFTDWDVKVTVDGKPPDLHHRKAGSFAWTDAVIHTVENVGKTEGRVLRIELKH